MSVYWLLSLGIALTLIGFAVAGLVQHRRRAVRLASGEAIPASPLEKRAWAGLGIGVVIAATQLGVLLSRGPTNFFDDRVQRLSLDALMIVGLAAFFALARARRKGEVLFDERDRKILEHASKVQASAVLGLVAIWAIGLTEAYWDAGQVPIAFPILMFWSALVVYLLALPIGILWASRVGHAEG